MPKIQVIDPTFIRAPGKIQFTDIPVNVYNKSIKDEKDNFSKADFVRIYNDFANTVKVSIFCDISTRESHGNRNFFSI